MTARWKAISTDSTGRAGVPGDTEDPPVAIRVADHIIGGAAPCFLIAEAGVNHNGDPGLAHELVDAAAAAGAHAVKFQTFDPSRLVTRGASRAAYQVRNTGSDASQYEMLEALALPPEAYPELRDHAAETGLLFLSTPFDEESASFLRALGMPAFKIPSGEVTNLPLLAHVASFGSPVLLSTGMATLDEVARAVATLREMGDPPLALLHCVTSYPVAAEHANLRAMDTLRSTFGVPVGWSDHTEGSMIACAAAALGADLIEKHFTLDRDLPGPDHRASLEPDELATLVREIRRVEAALGDGIKRPAPPEMELVDAVRKSLYARRDLEAGHRLEEGDLIALRPASGLPPYRIRDLLGRRLRAPLARGEAISEEALADGT